MSSLTRKIFGGGAKPPLKTSSRKPPLSGLIQEQKDEGQVQYDIGPSAVTEKKHYVQDAPPAHPHRLTIHSKLSNNAL